MKQVRRPSVVPIYAVAAVWLIFGLVSPLNSVNRFILCAVISFAAFLICNLIFPGTTVEVEQKPDTGNAEADDVITRGRQSAARIRELNAQILDSTVTQKVDQIEAVTGQILAYVEKNPEKTAQIQTFMDYYLPTTIKLLTTYVELQNQSVKGENIGSTMDKISAMLDTILAAFTKQLDSLFESVSVDVSADIQVMEQTLASNGLINENDF